MKQGWFTILENARLARDTFRMVLEGDCSAVRGSGQFVQVAVPGLYLRRPFSVSDRDGNRLVLVYKCVGQGTAALVAMTPGQQLDLVTGLGHGFNVSAAGRRSLLVGGSVGTAPLLLLARELKAAGKAFDVALGFGDIGLAFYVDEFKALGAQVKVATQDGSLGREGLVTDAIRALDGTYDYYYCCGSKPMMRAVYEALPYDGECSMEERMGCGTGICYGCSIPTQAGMRRVCADGPVFRKEELVWEKI